jgi:tetratricopeptide (TPR) repeat protein
MPERRPPASHCNLLWARSGARCAFPGCNTDLVYRNATAWVTVGEIAHIHAHSPGGARHDPGLDMALVDSYENCLLLCREHHRIIDGSPADYAPDVLREWKAQHEAGQIRSATALTPDALTVTPPLSHLFVERGAVIDTIANILAKTPVATVLGAQGSGKSQLAVRLWEREASHYTFRWWVRASSRENAASDMAGLAPLVGLQSVVDETTEALAQRVAEALKSMPGWLLVFDDARTPDDLLGLVPSADGHVLITTRNAGWHGLGEIVQVPALSPEEAREVVVRATPSITGADADKIGLLCEFLPIAVAQTSSFLAASGMSSQTMLSLLTSDRAALLNRGTAAPHATLVASIDQTLTAISTPALALLNMLAMIAPIPFKLRTGGHIEGDEDDPLADPLVIEDALVQLRSFSLAERDGDIVIVHELVQEIVRDRIRGDIDEAIATVRAADAVYSQLPERTTAPENWQTFESLLPHVEALRDRVGAVDALPGSVVGHLLNRAGSYHEARGDIDLAEQTFREALSLAEDQADKHELGLRASLLNNLGNVLLRRRGDAAAAREAIEESLRLKEGLYGLDHALVGITCGALGAVEQRAGNLETAKTLHQRALSIHQLVGDDRRAAAALEDLAAIAIIRDDGATAAALAQQAINLTKDDSDSWIEEERAHLILAELHELAGRLEDALAEAAAGRAAAERIGIESELLARAVTAQARILAKMNDPSAMQLFAESLDMLSRTDPHGVATATTLGDFGAAQFEHGDLESGLRKLRKSEAALVAMLPEAHDTVCRAQLMLAHALTRIGASQEARGLFTRVLEKHYSNHLLDEANVGLQGLDG